MATTTANKKTVCKGTTKLASNHDEETIRLELNEPLALQVASDLHLEFYNDDPKRVPSDIIQREAPILCLLGDVGLCNHSSILEWFLKKQSKVFEHVLFVAGNHEFYNNHDNTLGNPYTVEEQLHWIQALCDSLRNVHFLERRVVEVQGVRILGTTLWSEIPPHMKEEAEDAMNDYHLSYIADHCRSKQLMTVDFTNAWFRRSVQWLEHQIQEARVDGYQVVVLTHHTPCMDLTSHPRFSGSSMSCCFSTNLQHLLTDPVRVWACGHTHYNFDIAFTNDNKLVPATRLVSNQRGYPGSILGDYDSRGIIICVSDFECSTELAKRVLSWKEMTNNASLLPPEAIHNCFLRRRGSSSSLSSVSADV